MPFGQWFQQRLQNLLMPSVMPNWSRGWLIAEQKKNNQSLEIFLKGGVTLTGKNIVSRQPLAADTSSYQQAYVERYHADALQTKTYNLPFFNSRGECCQIRCVRYEPKASIATEVSGQHILCVVGRGDVANNRTDECCAMALAGFVVTIFDFPGIEPSQGKLHNIADMTNSVRTVFLDLIYRKGIQRHDLLLTGNCMGAAIALQALVGEPGIRCFFSNGPGSLHGAINDVARTMQLGLMRGLKYILPFDYKQLARKLLAFVECQLYAEQIIKQSDPRLWPVFLNIVQRRMDGVVDKSALALVAQQCITELKRQQQLNNAEMAEIKQTIHWVKSVNALPTHRIKQYHQAQQSLARRCLPSTKQVRDSHHAHYSRLQDLRHIDNRQVEQLDLLVDFAVQSHLALSKNPKLRRQVPFPHYQAPAAEQLSVRNWLLGLSGGTVVIYSAVKIFSLLVFVSNAYVQEVEKCSAGLHLTPT